MVKRLVNVVTAPLILAFSLCASGAASAEALNDTTYATKSVRHMHRHHGGTLTPYDSAVGLGSGRQPGGGYSGLDRPSSAAAAPGSGWHQPGFGGTLNPGWGYSFGPQLGGVGR